MRLAAVSFAFCALVSFLQFPFQEAQEGSPAPPGQEETPVNKGGSFSAMQLTGEPDTPRAGDYGTCWAAATSDGGKVWIELVYERRVLPREIWVYENCAPGALYQVTAIDDEEEIQLWRGADPTPRIAPKGISKIKLDINRRLNRFRIYLDCKKVPGWNEIDAVGLVDGQRQIHWAVSATASSVYSRGELVKFIDPFADPHETHLEKLADLKQQIKQQWITLQSLQQQLKQGEAKLVNLEVQLKQLERQGRQLRLRAR